MAKCPCWCLYGSAEERVVVMSWECNELKIWPKALSQYLAIQLSRINLFKLWIRNWVTALALILLQSFLLISVDINDCAHSLCQNGAQCVDHLNNFSCICQPGFTGPLCDQGVLDSLINLTRHEYASDIAFLVEWHRDQPAYNVVYPSILFVMIVLRLWFHVDFSHLKCRYNTSSTEQARICGLGRLSSYALIYICSTCRISCSNFHMSITSAAQWSPVAALKYALGPRLPNTGLRNDARCKLECGGWT